jgi:hypothetical protein
MLDVLINLIFGFFPWKLEYNKYKLLIMNFEPRRTTRKTDSFSSTVNDSKGIKENISESNFEHSPTEIIIVCNNKNNNNFINTNNNNIINIINNVNNNIINNNTIIKKKSTKKINFSKDIGTNSEEKSKNKTEIKYTKKVNINNINIINNNKESIDFNETERNLNDNTANENNEQNSNNKNELSMTISSDKKDSVAPPQKIILTSNKK